MLKLTASTITFTPCKSGNSNPDQKGLSNRHTQTGFSAKSKQTMLNRLRNFMFFRRYELTANGVRELKQISNVTFLTVTLPAKQVHTDIEIKSICLDNFMNKLRYHNGKLDYVWKAEAQENGNIHFHFLIDRFLNMNITDKLWHDSIELLGYVTSFEKKYGHRSPPTNKMETTKSLKRVIGYATKYMAKIDGYRPIMGQCWHSSKSLQTDVKTNVIMRREDENKIKVALREMGLYCVVNEYSEKYFLEDTTNIKNLPSKLRNIYSDVISYHLGRKECETGMERKIVFEEVTQLKDAQKKCKLPLSGYEIFDSSLFNDTIEKKVKPRKKVSSVTDKQMKESYRIQEYYKKR